MVSIEGLYIIGFIALFVISLLIVFVLTVRTKDKLSNRLFALFLLLIAFDISGWLTSIFDIPPSNYTLFRPNLVFLQLPVFYLYVLSACYSDFVLKPKYLIHGIPFALVNCILIPRFYAVDFASKVDFLVQSKEMLEIKSIYIFIHLQILFYFIVIFRVIKRYRKLYLQNYTSSADLIYKWLFQVSCVLAIFYAVALLKNIFKYSASDDILNWMYLLIGLFGLFIFCWYILKALNNPHLFRGVDSKLQLVTDLDMDTNRIGTTNTRTLEMLKAYMVDEKPFLDPTLTLQGLAKKVSLPARELSVLINQELKQHFFDFVNAYRIEKAMEILKDPIKKKLTILEILYEVGFNSKSSFNTAFKKHVGITPTAYRKSQS